MPGKRFIIVGRVQGVGFRSHVQLAAISLGITGEVWNKLDGAVECMTYHPEAAVLDRFEALLSIGPGRVMEVRSSSVPEEFYANFSVGQTRP